MRLRIVEPQCVNLRIRHPKKIVEKAEERVSEMARPHRSENLHICIIHGYNKDTEEIAFTDSWGPRFVERWISVAEAEHFSSGWCWLIDY